MLGNSSEAKAHRASSGRSRPIYVASESPSASEGRLSATPARQRLSAPGAAASVRSGPYPTAAISDATRTARARVLGTRRSAYDDFDAAEWVLGLCGRIRHALASRPSSSGPRRPTSNREVPVLQQPAMLRKADRSACSLKEASPSSAGSSFGTSGTSPMAPPTMTAREWAKRAQEDFEKRRAVAAAEADIVPPAADSAAPVETGQGTPAEAARAEAVSQHVHMTADSIKELFSAGGLEAGDGEKIDFSDFFDKAEPLQDEAPAGPSALFEGHRSTDGTFDLQGILEHRARLAQQQTEGAGGGSPSVLMGTLVGQTDCRERGADSDGLTSTPLIQELRPGSASGSLDSGNGDALQTEEWSNATEADNATLPGKRQDFADDEKHDIERQIHDDDERGIEDDEGSQRMAVDSGDDIDANGDDYEDFDVLGDSDGVGDIDDDDVDNAGVDGDGDLDSAGESGEDVDGAAAAHADVRHLAQPGQGADVDRAIVVLDSDDDESDAAMDDEDQTSASTSRETSIERGDNDASHAMGLTTPSHHYDSDEDLMAEDVDDDGMGYSQGYHDDDGMGCDSDDESAIDEDEMQSARANSPDHLQRHNIAGDIAPVVGGAPSLNSSRYSGFVSASTLLHSSTTDSEAVGAPDELRHHTEPNSTLGPVASPPPTDFDRIDPQLLDGADHVDNAEPAIQPPGSATATPDGVSEGITTPPLPVEAEPGAATQARPEVDAVPSATAQPTAEIAAPLKHDAAVPGTDGEGAPVDDAGVVDEEALLAPPSSNAGVDPIDVPSAGLNAGFPLSPARDMADEAPLPTSPLEGGTLIEAGGNLTPALRAAEGISGVISEALTAADHPLPRMPAEGGDIMKTSEIEANPEEPPVRNPDVEASASEEIRTAPIAHDELSSPRHAHVEVIREEAIQGKVGEPLDDELALGEHPREDPQGRLAKDQAGDDMSLNVDGHPAQPDLVESVVMAPSTGAAIREQAAADEDANPDMTDDKANFAPASTAVMAEQPASLQGKASSRTEQRLLLRSTDGSTPASSPLSSAATLPPVNPIQSAGERMLFSALPPSSMFRHKHRHHHHHHRHHHPLPHQASDLRMLSPGDPNLPAGGSQRRLDPTGGIGTLDDASGSGDPHMLPSDALVRASASEQTSDAAAVEAEQRPQADDQKAKGQPSEHSSEGLAMRQIRQDEDEDEEEESHGPSTRSQCTFHRLRFLSLPGQPTFIVPQCSILHDVAKNEGARDVGQATNRQNELKVEFNPDELPLEVRHSLSRIIGVQMLADAAVVPGSSAEALLRRPGLTSSSGADSDREHGDPHPPTTTKSPGPFAGMDEPMVSLASPTRSARRSRTASSASSSNGQRSPKLTDRKSGREQAAEDVDVQGLEADSSGYRDESAPRAIENAKLVTQSTTDGAHFVEPGLTPGSAGKKRVRGRRRKHATDATFQPAKADQDGNSDDDAGSDSEGDQDGTKPRSRKKRAVSSARTDGPDAGTGSGQSRRESPRSKNLRRSRAVDGKFKPASRGGEGIDKSDPEEQGSLVSGVQTRKQQQDETEVLDQVVGSEGVGEMEGVVEGERLREEEREAEEMDVDEDQDGAEGDDGGVEEAPKRARRPSRPRNSTGDTKAGPLATPRTSVPAAKEQKKRPSPSPPSRRRTGVRR
ncbi:uncharacterized protein PFL1_03336 [Pseudozyma flocculosa PF-1]|uniref:Uncharacterized protein n=1 Tax=Pseudozyma flocculosa PF-1 TaxID=1277687 RepID=A0A061H865_9BASI|nr:uncharacterized protein PFL1_03336 [Pseudozyma flocculosa PF-1]EPQ29047.1 hypothetical protein PFL1_03336 [Pseudozyma flocculosa PF-1]